MCAGGQGLAQLFILKDLGKRALRALLPPDLFVAGRALRCPAQYVLQALPPSKTEVEKLYALFGSKPSINLVIPTAFLLTRYISLPHAAEAKSEAAIGLYLRQMLPAQGRGMVWRWSLLQRGAETSSYGVFILKESDLRGLINAFAKHDISLGKVTTDTPGAPAFYEDPAIARSSKFWWRTTVVTVIASLFWATAVPWWRAHALEHNLTGLAVEIETLQNKVVATRASADAANSAIGDLNHAIAKFNDGRHKLDIVASLTQLLSDDTWVSELTFISDKAYIAMFTKAKVADILTAIDAENWSKSVRLDGPIIADSLSGQDRFQVVVDLVGTAADE